MQVTTLVSLLFITTITIDYKITNFSLYLLTNKGYKAHFMEDKAHFSLWYHTLSLPHAVLSLDHAIHAIFLHCTCSSALAVLFEPWCSFGKLEPHQLSATKTIGKCLYSTGLVIKQTDSIV